MPPKKKAPARKAPAARRPAKKTGAARRPAKKTGAARRPAKKAVDAGGTTTRICAMCGAIATCPEGGLPPGWSITVDGRTGVEYMCDDCARRNIRAIEGKLPQEWWE